MNDKVSVVAALPGIALLVLFWLAMAGFATNMSTSSANAGGVRLLWLIVLLEVAAVGGAVAISTLSRHWRSRSMRLLPWLS